MEPKFTRLTTSDHQQWLDVLSQTVNYDVYHLPQYHALAERMSDARAELLVYQNAGRTIALPVLVRSLASVPGVDAAGRSDITSVYGYAGPIADCHNLSAEVVKGFSDQIQEYCREQRIVSVFSRLNPLIDCQPQLLENGLGGTVPIGRTVSIDLTIPPEEQWSQFRNNHQRDITRARNEGLHCVLDDSWLTLDDFVDVYHETMRRVGAGAGYFFSRDYFRALRELLQSHYALFSVTYNGDYVAGGLFSSCNGIIQYHLGGSTLKALSLAPSKLLFDTVRHYGNQTGAHTLHLGGGVGSQSDGLYRFKAGFSKSRHVFRVWRFIPDQSAYDRLVAEAGIAEESAIDSGFFPTYRHPQP